MSRPKMPKGRPRVRVEVSLSPQLAQRVYDYAEQYGFTLSQAGERLFSSVLPANTSHQAWPEENWPKEKGARGGQLGAQGLLVRTGVRCGRDRGGMGNHTAT